MKDYDTETAQKRIEMLCTQKGMKPTVVARESGAGTNSIANLKRGSMLSADKLAKIADYLECSVDYLLGRTDNPVQANSTEAYHVSGDNKGEIAMTFWEVFSKLCNKIGKKPNPVGKEIGVSSAAIANWKAGSIPNGETLMKIADYFNCSTDYLLGRTDDPTPTPHGNVSGDNSFQNIQDSPVINKHSTAPPENKPDGVTSEFMRVFENLDFDDKVELMGLAVKMKKGA